MKYNNEHLKEISFPIGGIGTGSIGLSGNGRLIDWEIFNRPSKGSMNGYSHIAVKAKTKSGKIHAKVLNGDLQKDLIGQYSKLKFSGYGFGPSAATMCGFPHFESCEFIGEFPIARINFKDKDFPADVSLTAFNPFIPLDDKNSSIPAAFFEISVTNTKDEAVEYTTAFSVMNPFEISKNVAVQNDQYSMIKMLFDDINVNEINYGDLTLACDCKNTVVQNYWYRGGWQDGIATFWREFSSENDLKERNYDEHGKNDMCSVAAKFEVGPNETKTVRFVLSWNIPNNYNYWNPLKDESGKDVTWKNYYATVFTDSVASALYSLDHWAGLYERTLKFKNSLFHSTLDAAVVDAVSSTLSVLKSPTVLRLEDGSFYGWEGVDEQDGSCEGTCSHVWNYAYALCFLFPKLERSIRELEFKYNIYEDGAMDFRLKLPLGREKGKFGACVDGQMGSVIKAYREWKISGDDKWLKEHWASIEKVLEYAWSPQNKDEWDSNKSGVIEGRQHHTLDMELFGASSWLQGFYLAALKVASEMAKHLGMDAKHKEYTELFEKGYLWTKENLFNGKYFIQKIDLHDKKLIEHFNCGERYWNEEAGEIKYQIGDGCEIDQLCAQWHANICGLGDVFDKTQVETALHNIYKNNFKHSMRNIPNPWRIFSLNDEGGAIICDYPDGTYKPMIPISYCEESMHGFEYQLAGLLISEHMVKEGLEIVKSVRNRYNGKNRNPWNEIECGSNYARSMASFALIPIFSGFRFDLPNKKIGFHPIGNLKKFKSLWCVDSGWGNFECEQDVIRLTIEEGFLKIHTIGLEFINSIQNVYIDGKEAAYSFVNGNLSFEESEIKKGVEIHIS